MDPCFAIADEHPPFDAVPLLKLLSGLARVSARTPPERVVRAVAEEIQHRVRWAAQDLAKAPRDPAVDAALAALTEASLTEAAFPGARDALYAACQVALSPAYRSVLGWPEAEPAVRERVRGVLFTLGALVEQMPHAPYLRTLQNNPARRDYVRPEALGVSERSPRLPRVSEGPNGGFPTDQVPVGAEAPAAPARDMTLPPVTRAELARGNTRDSCWIALRGEVYDVTALLGFHPGGDAHLLRWAGQDATRAFAAAGHSAATEVFKLNYRVGRLVEGPEAPSPEIACP